MTKKRVHHIYLQLLSFVIISCMLASSYTVSSMETHQSTRVSTQKNSLKTDQALINPADILDSLVPYIVSQKNASGSWDFALHSQDNRVYTGLAGGLAGLGLQLLELSNQTSDLIHSDVKTKAVEVAQEIGDALANDSTTSGSYRYWNVSMTDGFVDLGLDFGVAGIMKFYAMLYNITQQSRFLDYTTQILNFIGFAANQTSGLHWNGTDMITLLKNNLWYPHAELSEISNAQFLDYVYNNDSIPNYTYFNGLGLGSLGVARAVLDTAQLVNANVLNTPYNDLIKSSLYWVHKQFNQSMTELSFPVAEPFTNMTSTSQAYGVSGAVDFMLDYYQVTGNTTYMTWANNTMNYLLGIDSSIKRIDYSYFLSDSGTDVPATKVELGLSHGRAGSLAALLHYVNVTKSWNLNATLQQEVINLHNLGTATDVYYKYPESISNGIKNNLGSIRFDLGGTGIMAFIASATKFLGMTSLNDDLAMTKAYLYSLTEINGNLTLIVDPTTQATELNPSIGMPAMYPALIVPVSGVLELGTKEVDWGQQPIGNSLAKSITLRNTGDTPLQASWADFSSTVFDAGNGSISLKAHQTYSLFITFNPRAETIYNQTITFKSNVGDNFVVVLYGIGYDNPQISTDNLLANNSVIKNRDPVKLQVGVTDSSSLAAVSVVINGTTGQMSATTGTDFSYTWDTSGLQNGTYVMRITATDSLGHSSNITYFYTAAIYDPPLKERIFSDAVMYTLIGLTVVMIGVLLVVNKKLKS